MPNSITDSIVTIFEFVGILLIKNGTRIQIPETEFQNPHNLGP